MNIICSEEKVVVLLQANKAAKWREFKSHGWIFLRTPGDISGGVCGDFSVSQTILIREHGNQNRYYKPNHDAFPNQVFFVPKPKWSKITVLYYFEPKHNVFLNPTK